MATERADPVPDDGLSVTALGVGVAVTVAMAGAVGLIRFSDSDPGEQSVVGPWGSLAFMVVIAAPAVVAVIGSLSRPWVLGAAGVAQLPMLLLSFSPFFFPLAVPALIFITQAASMRRGARRSRWQPVAAAATALFILAAPLCLIVHQDPISWSSGTGSGYASDSITATESVLALLCVVAAAVAGVVAPPDGFAST